MKRCFRALVPAVLLAGCAPDVENSPSLARRPVEDRGFAEPVAPAAPVAAPDPRLDAEIHQWTDRLADLGQRFGAAEAEARRAVDAAAGDAAGSDRWLDAHSSLAILDGLRAEGNSLLADVDERVAARGAALAAPYPALEVLRTAILAEGTQQADAIARLSGRLAPA